MPASSALSGCASIARPGHLGRGQQLERAERLIERPNVGRARLARGGREHEAECPVAGDGDGLAEEPLVVVYSNHTDGTTRGFVLLRSELGRADTHASAGELSRIAHAILRGGWSAVPQATGQEQ